MPPGVKRSLIEGFRVAGRSWRGIGLLVLAWAAVGLVVVISLILTRPPTTALENAATPPAAAIPAAAEDASATDATATAPAQTETEQQREVRTWLSRAWPMLALIVILLIAAGTLIQGGQIGYVTQQVRAGHAGWADISGAATRAFGALLGVMGLSLIAVMAAVGISVLALAGLAALPGVVAGVLGVLLVAALVVGVVWLSLRLALWPISIVAQRLGPIAGLKASWRLSRGRFWTLLGIAASLLAISLGIGLISALVEGLSNIIGGGIALAVQLLNALVSLAANFFLSFATMGALVRFHEDARGAAS